MVKPSIIHLLLPRNFLLLEIALRCPRNPNVIETALDGHRGLFRELAQTHLLDDIKYGSVFRVLRLRQVRWHSQGDPCSFPPLPFARHICVWLHRKLGAIDVASDGALKQPASWYYCYVATPPLQLLACCPPSSSSSPLRRLPFHLGCWDPHKRCNKRNAAVCMWKFYKCSMGVHFTAGLSSGINNIDCHRM